MMSDKCHYLSGSQKRKLQQQRSDQFNKPNTTKLSEFPESEPETGPGPGTSKVSSLEILKEEDRTEKYVEENAPNCCCKNDVEESTSELNISWTDIGMFPWEFNC